MSPRTEYARVCGNCTHLYDPDDEGADDDYCEEACRVEADEIFRDVMQYAPGHGPVGRTMRAGEIAGMTVGGRL